MNNKFYRELSEMAQEALQDLDRYEITGESGRIFDKIRSVGVACLDGEKINQSIKDDLPIRSHLDFQRAIFSMARLHSLTGGRENNQAVKSWLAYVKLIAEELSNRTNKKIITKVFYSWQANLPNKTNRGLIKDCLEKAISDINKELTIESRIQIDHDTSNVPGSPDIIHTILEKIDSSSIFVADVSITNSSQPNSNVMFELGYAIKSLGDPNIIMIFNEHYGKTKDLPFDLGFKRQMLYECSESEGDMSVIRKLLTRKIKQAISLIIENTE